MESQFHDYSASPVHGSFSFMLVCLESLQASSMQLFEMENTIGRYFHRWLTHPAILLHQAGTENQRHEVMH